MPDDTMIFMLVNLIFLQGYQNILMIEYDKILAINIKVLEGAKGYDKLNNNRLAD